MHIQIDKVGTGGYIIRYYKAKLSDPSAPVEYIAGSEEKCLRTLKNLIFPKVEDSQTEKLNKKLLYLVKSD